MPYTEHPLAACFIAALLCVCIFIAIRRDVRETKQRDNLLDLARGFARMDKASRAAWNREPDWTELRRGIEEQICLVSFQVDGMHGIAKIVASDGAKPFAFLRSVPPLLNDMYKRAQSGVVAEGDTRVMDALIRLDVLLTTVAQETVTEEEWGRFVQLLEDIEQLQKVICLLGTERLMVRPWGIRARAWK